jgi:hypothetical protein
MIMKKISWIIIPILMGGLSSLLWRLKNHDFTTDWRLEVINILLWVVLYFLVVKLKVFGS